ncbi:MAG: amino acid adenylation domain-containing protein [Anaerolineae bacterium]|nr:amino acid adenylation domain-containing protein [Anaerolineae bacterium]
MEDKIEAGYPLSSMQQGMLFHSRYHPHSGVDIEQMVITLPEKVEVIALHQAWQTVIDRHAVLRTAFRWEGLDQPLQQVYQQIEVPLAQYDWRHLADSAQEAQFEAHLAADRSRGFTLAHPPLLRLALFWLGEAHYRCLWTFHHILLDGRSFPTILAEVFDIYDALRQGQTLSLAAPPPYRFYIDWLQQQDHNQSALFWRELLQGHTSPTPFAVDQPSPEPAQPGSTYNEQEIRISEALTSHLRTLAEQHNLTLNTFVQGAWAVLLSRYSGEADVVFGATRACRRSSVEQAEKIVGLFINTLPLRIKVAPDQMLLAWLQNLRAQQLAIRPHEHTPLANIQAWSDVPGRLPLFESILVFENFQLDTVMKQRGGAWLKRTIRLLEQTNYPLTLNGYAGSQLLLKISYDCHRFTEAVIERMLGHLEMLLTGMATDLEQPLKQLPLLTAAERRQILVEWNNTQRDYPPEATLQQLFEAQVARTPQAIALTFAETALTYDALNEQANQLAHHLRSLGVGPEVLVGIFMERSLEMVISIYAVIKAGGAYVPLDPDYPAERVAFMLADAAVPVLLTQQKLRNALPESTARVICLDSEQANLAAHSSENPISEVTAAQLAYVIFTSGSTGQPKGVMNTHRGICNRLFWMQEAYQLTPADRVLQKTPFSFDVSVWEFFWPLLVGARLVIAEPGGHKDPDYLVNVIIEQQITTLHFVPSMLKIFLDAEQVAACRSLKRVICSGEALPYELQQRFFECLAAELHNLYGPTEAAVDVSYWVCHNDPSRTIVPIGRPIANTQLYILDAALQPVPIGVAGELHIGGVQVARGYLNRPELTAERFIDSPFALNEAHNDGDNSKSELPPIVHRQKPKLYKTGDLARYLPDGAIEYLGRMDYQVKIRGFRIELGEIETILAQHPAVKTNLVVASETAQMADKRLIAYVVPTQTQPPTVSDLRSFLSKKLPDYMVPTMFVMLEAMPLTPNGKINRRGLPAPNLARPELTQVYVAPRSEIEEALANIWLQLLPVERVGIYDDFFELGGHSLLATQTIARIQQRFQVTLPLQTIFDTPTVAELAVRLVQQESEHLAQEDLAEMLAALENLPDDQVEDILKNDESLLD